MTNNAFVFTPRFKINEIPLFKEDDQISEELNKLAKQRFDQLVDFWITHHRHLFSDVTHTMNVFDGFEDVQVPVDLEDWTENAHSLKCAVDTGKPVYEVIRDQDEECVKRLNDFNEGKKRAEPDMVKPSEIPSGHLHVFKHGFRSKNTDLGFGHLLQISDADRDAVVLRYNDAPEIWNDGFVIIAGQYDYRYGDCRGNCVFPNGKNPYLDFYQHPEMKSFLSREADVSYSLYDEENMSETNIVTRCHRMVSEGKKLFIKNIAEHKTSGYCIIDLPASATREAVKKELQNSFGHFMFEISQPYLVQEYSDINYETRFLFVAGQLVAGAGCVQKFTPLQNEKPFDDKLEVHRNEGDIVHAPEIVEQLKAFASTVYQDVFDGKGEMAIDVAIINGAPGVIEVNGVDRIGLYAMDNSRFIHALGEIQNELKLSLTRQEHTM